ncbi:hypothetical protein Q5752_001686 [Cryptotrichosporon argae]
MSDSATSQRAAVGCATLFALPHEIIEHVFTLLSISERLVLRRTCSTLRDIYDSSAVLQYDFALVTTAHLDVPFRPAAPPASPATKDDAKGPAPAAAAHVVSPHTGRPRPTIPSVALAPWPAAAAPRRVPGVARSPAEKLEALRARERNWETLEAGQERTFRITGNTGVYELQEGIMLMCDDYSIDSKPETIRLVPLPSVDDPDLEEPPIPTKKDKLPFLIADLTMDPTQDLIVVSEFEPAAAEPGLLDPIHRFHLLRLSDFSPHPLASSPTLDFPPFAQGAGQTRQLLQVMGDTLVVLVSRFEMHWIVAGFNMIGAGMAPAPGNSEEEVVAWNWKTGRVLGRLPLPYNAWFSSLSMLTPTTVMITTACSGPLATDDPRILAAQIPPVIQVWSFLPCPHHKYTPRQPLRAQQEDETSYRPRLLATLRLPAFASGTIVTTFDVRPDPAFPVRRDAAGPSPGRALGLGDKLFTQDPEKGVLVFDLQALEPPGMDGLLIGLEAMESRSFELFMLRETLVGLAKAGEDRLRTSWDTLGAFDDGSGQWMIDRTLDWADWGVRGARLMPASMRNRTWVCLCSGYRHISLVPSRRPHRPEPVQQGHNIIEAPARPSDLQLLDFSPYAVRRDLARRRDARHATGAAGGAQDRDGADHGADADDAHDNDGAIDGSPVDASSVGEDAPRPAARRARADDEPDAPPDADANADVDVDVSVVVAPTVLPRARMWADDVVSALPYRKVVRARHARANGVMMDDQRVIIINSTGRRNGDWTDVRQEMTVLCM